MVKQLNRSLVHAALIAVLGLIVYSNTFNSPFQFDETKYIINNPFIIDLAYPTDAFRQDQTMYMLVKHRYIGFLTFALNYRLNGFEVAGYHIVNLLIHIMSALLVYLIALFSFRTPFLSRSPLKERSRYIALFSALLFVSHPVQTEAVTYIFQRFASLTGLFYMLSVALYLKWRLESRPPDGITGKLRPLLWYWGSVASAVLAMKTKQNAVTLPVMIAVFEFSFFAGEIKARAAKLIPLFATCLLIPATYLMGMGYDVEHATTGADISRIDYLINEFPAIVKYLRLLILPIDQNLDYDYPVLHSFFEPAVYLSFLLLGAILGVALYLFRRSRSGEPGLRLAALGIFWFFIALSIESGLIPNKNMICEYRVYLPSAGIFISAATLFFMALGIPGKGTGIKATAAGLIALTIVASLSVTAYARNEVWRDEISLWSDVVSKSPNKARGYNNLGSAYLKRQNYDLAIEMFNKALAADPTLALAYYNLGRVYRERKDLSSARRLWEKALTIDPHDSKTLNQMGSIYYLEGSLEKAKDFYAMAVEYDRANVEAYYNLALTLAQLNEPEKAIFYYRSFLAIAPREYEGLFPKVREKISTLSARLSE
ncbi:MAG: tetratricopeptide repeat protein [Nitrospirae bacterium]|nr:MAG: tetratricopeptide repeat protein [Nitrospirota bacterium]